MVDKDQTYNLHVRLTPQAHQAMQDIQDMSGLSITAIVIDALLFFNVLLTRDFGLLSPTADEMKVIHYDRVD